MVSSKLPRITVLLAVGLALAGCAEGSIAYGTDPADLPGTWRADLGSASPVVLTLNADGSLDGADWPEQLNCTDDVESREQLGLSRRVDVAGHWTSDIEGSDAYVRFFLDPSPCSRGSFPGVIWRDHGGLQFCVLIPRSLDPDSATFDTTLIFRPDGEQESSMRGCGL